MRYKIILLALLLLVFISCNKDAGKLSDAISSAQQGVQNIQVAYDAALLIKDNIIENKKSLAPNEKEKLLEGYKNALEISRSSFEQAKNIYEESVKNNPEDAFVLNNLAHSYMWLNQKDKAQHYFDQALKYCKSDNLKNTIEMNKGFFPQVEKYYDLFQEVNEHIQ